MKDVFLGQSLGVGEYLSRGREKMWPGKNLLVGSKAMQVLKKAQWLVSDWDYTLAMETQDKSARLEKVCSWTRLDSTEGCGRLGWMEKGDMNQVHHLS